MSPLLALVIIAGMLLFMAWLYGEFDGRFKLENSRQFVMNEETAFRHGLSERAEEGKIIELSYYGKKYKYKVIRVFAKEYRSYYNYSRVLSVQCYLILEKMTDGQPPHYKEMEKMRRKEARKRK